ncbi:hypothetical protein C8J56DRAFT_227256 [Mycena floridula]|nr:hypothetical protein C8J56DRAFT_227256 [Mycena floridula]
MDLSTNLLLSAGILLTSTWANLFLYTCEVVLAVHYLVDTKRSVTRIQRIVVLGALTVDTACTLAVCGNAFLYLVIFPIRGQFPTENLWPLPFIVIANAFSALLEQSFLVLRYWRLSQNKITTGILILLVFVHLAFAIISGTYIAAHPQYGFAFGDITNVGSVSLSAATDLLIGLAQLWTLQSFQSSFTSTKQLIRRVSLISSTSGMFCSFSSTVMLVLMFKQAQVFDLFFSCLGRVYSLTILINLFTISPKPNSSTLQLRHGTEMISEINTIRFNRASQAQTDLTSIAVFDSTISQPSPLRVNDGKSFMAAHDSYPKSPSPSPTESSHISYPSDSADLAVAV